MSKATNNAAETVAPAYWLNGTAYCVECVEHEVDPCMSESEKGRATRGRGEGRCGCCKTPFAE